MSNTLRVAYWNNIPSPYFVERMSALADTGRFDVHGIFNVERHADRSWDVVPDEWRFNGHWATQTRTGLYDATPIVRLLKPDLLVSLYGEPSFALNGLRAARHSGRWAIRIVPTYSAWEKRGPVKELTKRGLGSLVDGAKVPGPDGRAYAERIGIPAERVVEIQQSVPVKHFATSQGRAAARQRLAIPDHEFVFVYVGRLWEGKGLGVLMDGAGLVPQARPWSLLVVGDGPMDSEIRERHDVPTRLTGFLQRDHLPDTLAAADCLVFPTLGDPFGLVVEECMAAGMPVVTSDQMGDAARRVERTGAGILVRDHTPAAWAAAMTQMLDPDKHRRWRDNAKTAAREVGHDAYVRDFSSFVDQMLSLPPRHRLLHSGHAGVEA